MTGISAMSPYGDGRFVCKIMIAIPAFWIAVSNDKAIICCLLRHNNKEKIVPKAYPENPRQADDTKSCLKSIENYSECLIRPNQRCIKKSWAWWYYKIQQNSRGRGLFWLHPHCTWLIKHIININIHLVWKDPKST